MTDLIHFLLSHLPLTLSLILVLVLIFLNDAFSKRKQAQSISPYTAIDKMNHDAATVIDLRDNALFQKGHIIDAISASSDDFTQGRMNKYKEKPIIMVCNQGTESAKVTQHIKSLGFTEVYVLEGGMNGWQSASLPVIKGK